ncbi:MAG TPA: ComEC/Rec2 family competence protein [Spirochaetota bacterium]|nr:ComEC/Rec2 family competence protein [Spirochaetota bacterium]
MSDSSSKSEGYSSFLRDAAVPSTPLCCYVIFSVLRSYNNVSGIYGIIFTFVFFILFILSLALTALKYKKLFYNKKQIIFSSAFIILICFVISFFLTGKINNLTDGSHLPESLENISVVIDDISLKRYSSEIYFHTPEETTPQHKGIIYYQGENIFNKGDTIFIHKKIYKIAVNSKNGFNSYLISRGIHFTAGLSETDITILKKNNISFSTFIQNTLLKRIDLLFDNRTAGVVKALLTGNQSFIEKKIMLQFRDSGVLHCLSASGLHVAIFAAIPAFLLIPFFRRNIAMFVSLLAVLFYLCITDMPVSLLRAVIMFAFFYFQLILFRKRNVFNYLMLTCSIILCISPWEIFSPGFQLSFAATGGILLFYKPYRKSLESVPAIIADTTAVTLSAQIITLPIILFHMNQLNTAGIAANIIVIPLITLIMGVSMSAILISVFSIPAGILSGDLTDLLLNFSLMITNFFSNLKLNFYVYDITPFLFVLIAISLIPLINGRKITRLKFYPVLLSVLLCTLYLKKYCQFNETSYNVTMGNSIAEIRVENKRQILRLNLKDGVDTDKIISGIKIKNPDIKIIELADISASNILASRKILNEYIIDEYRFAGIPDLNNIFKKIIFQLEKDNVIVKFVEKPLPE